MQVRFGQNVSGQAVLPDRFSHGPVHNLPHHADVFFSATRRGQANPKSKGLLSALLAPVILGLGLLAAQPASSEPVLQPATTIEEVIEGITDPEGRDMAGFIYRGHKDNPRLLVKELIRSGSFMLRGYSPAAVEVLDAALKIAHMKPEETDPSDLPRIHNLLGNAYMSGDQPDKAFVHYLEALAALDTLPEAPDFASDIRMNAQYTLGQILLKRDEPVVAREYLEKAKPLLLEMLADYSPTVHAQVMAEFHGYMGESFVQEGRRALDTGLRSRLYDRGEEEYREALALVVASRSSHETADRLIHITLNQEVIPRYQRRLAGFLTETGRKPLEAEQLYLDAYNAYNAQHPYYQKPVNEVSHELALFYEKTGALEQARIWQARAEMADLNQQVESLSYRDADRQAKAVALYSQGLEVLEAVPNALFRERGFLHDRLGFTYSYKGLPDLTPEQNTRMAIEHLETAMGFYREAEQRGENVPEILIPNILSRTGEQYLKLKEYPQAIQALEESLREFHSRLPEDYVYTGGVQTNLAKAWLYSGDKGKADRYFTDGMADLKRSGNENALSGALWGYAKALSDNGFLGESETLYREARPLVDASGFDFYRTPFYRDYAALLEKMGKDEEARKLMDSLKRN